eukprot:NODE_84_length_22354_cov_0.646506.p18 type:complete len:128 gc:universal NODE_84_length_22354_cov_0.646506:14834-14451(-)
MMTILIVVMTTMMIMMQWIWMNKKKKLFTKPEAKTSLLLVLLPRKMPNHMKGILNLFRLEIFTEMISTFLADSEQMPESDFFEAVKNLKDRSYSDLSDFSRDEISFYLNALMDNNKVFVADGLVTKL